MQGAKSASSVESRRHSNVAPSSEVNSKEGLEFLVSPFGPELIVVAGPVVSTVQLRLAGVGSALPSVSTARTRNVCAPSLSGPARVCGEAQTA